MKDETRLLKGMDSRERSIVMNLFLFQLGNPKGLTFGELWDLGPVQEKMSRQTFSHRLKDMLERNLLEREVIKKRRGNPTLYRLNSKLFTGLKKTRDLFYPWDLRGKIESFEKDIASFETQKYVDANMELLFGLVGMLAVAMIGYCDTEIVRWLFYEATYENVEQVLRNIVNRASTGKEDKEKTLAKLFDVLEVFARKPIGKRFGLDAVYNSKQKIIKTAMERTDP